MRPAVDFFPLFVVFWFFGLSFFFLFLVFFFFFCSSDSTLW